VLSLATGEHWFLPVRPETWLANAYLVVFGTIIGFSLTLYVLARWTASANSYAFLLSPLVTVVLGGVILGEVVEPAFALGGALVLLGVYVGVAAGIRPLRAARRPYPPREEPPGAA
jgi:drug/metabolite transporter (DMT)-like permease